MAPSSNRVHAKGLPHQKMVLMANTSVEVNFRGKSKTMYGSPR